MEQVTLLETPPTDSSASGKVEVMFNPVPLSFPSVLRNSKLADRFAHLRDPAALGDRDIQSSVNLKKRSRDEREGKRWVRRRENARFVNNPHIVQASSRDMQIEPPWTRRTFPEPLPPYLPRSVSAPEATLPMFDPSSATMGHYSMSFKGMRRTLRNHGPRAQSLVHEIEKEIKDWLSGVSIHLPDENEDVLMIHGRAVGNTLTITELSRTPLQLVWSIEQDAFARYIVHCCARYHKVVSYSKDIDGRRLTFLLRPNVTRNDYATRNTLDTPPVTESDYSLGVLSEVDIISVDENESTPNENAPSDVEAELSAHRGIRHRRLSSVSERENESGVIPDNTPCPVRLRPPLERDEPAEYGDNDNDNDNDNDDDSESVNDDLAHSVDSLDLNPITREPPIRYASQLAGRIPLRERRGMRRSPSSPSHSRSPCPPSRCLRKGRNRLARRATKTHHSGQSFYDFLYS